MAAKHPIDNVHDLGAPQTDEVGGDFVDLNDERWYVIRNVDHMPPFFISVISSDDHWLFVSSTGGLTAGRVSPDTALFPYVTVDRIHDSLGHTGPVTVVRLLEDGFALNWEPFNHAQNDRFQTTRNLYKSILGHKLCFEECNHDLGLAFRYTWMTSAEYGFVRHSELINLESRPRSVDVFDGLQNLLPAGTPRFTQTNSSNLVDAYKWSEYDPRSGLALLTLYSGITDRAEPCESLKATVAFCLGLDDATVLISSEQLRRFRGGAALETETLRRGVRGAFAIATRLELEASSQQDWQIVINAERTQDQVVALREKLKDKNDISRALTQSVASASNHLARIMANGDAYQSTNEPIVASHHYANVLFNILRGGVFHDQHRISRVDLLRTIRSFNREVFEQNRALLEQLPENLTANELRKFAGQSNDPQLRRLCGEYLPITFGRRHGDPSRPWNQFAIRLRDTDGAPLLSYEGNWRDIFQNWEALLFSFPDFTESVIAKFVNASTADGYNPYRITKDGIDWEVEDPEDPWSYIGYWGDHQIIYLLKLLELSLRFHPDRLGELLHDDIFCYANVPYRIRGFDALLADPKETVDYDDELAANLEDRVRELGADGKLVADTAGGVYQVNLLEKLLVPLLSKLGNFVVDGGIWMNTQRPEWNDANNALVGYGLSMVTLNYLRRYVQFLIDIVASDGRDSVTLSNEVATWLDDSNGIFEELAPVLGESAVSPSERFQTLAQLGRASERYRNSVYRQNGFSGRTSVAFRKINQFLRSSLTAIDHSIATNRRDDGMYHAYNLLEHEESEIRLARLYPMLEGQVSALSAGSLSAESVIRTVNALFDSDVYRPDQKTFMLYPDRQLPGFLQKNVIPAADVESVPFLRTMLAANDRRLVVRDSEGEYRFNARLVNEGAVDELFSVLVSDYGTQADDARSAVDDLYEKVFNHQAFTGRSGTMFGFEGLGCVYWHMVSKLLLAVQENYFWAIDNSADPTHQQQLGELYYRVRSGIGFNKTPVEFGAFPIDPYSHTPKHSGARQPGMTGQVKEEILTRFGELGLRIDDGQVRFDPRLLRAQEFDLSERSFCFVDVDDEWQTLPLPPASVAFTWCQVPIVYLLRDSDDEAVRVRFNDGSTTPVSGRTLSKEVSAEIFSRSGRVRGIEVPVCRHTLFFESPNTNE